MFIAHQRFGGGIALRKGRPARPGEDLRPCRSGSPTPHTLLAGLAFYGGGIAMITASSVAPPLFRSIWTALGVVALVAITAGFVLQGFPPIAALGEGGIERWNTYPIALWLVAFGSYLLAGRRIGEER